MHRETLTCTKIFEKHREFLKCVSHKKFCENIKILRMKKKKNKIDESSRFRIRAQKIIRKLKSNTEEYLVRFKRKLLRAI